MIIHIRARGFLPWCTGRRVRWPAVMIPKMLSEVVSSKCRLVAGGVIRKRTRSEFLAVCVRHVYSAAVTTRRAMSTCHPPHTPSCHATTQDATVAPDQHHHHLEHTAQPRRNMDHLDIRHTQNLPRRPSRRKVSYREYGRPSRRNEDPSTSALKIPHEALRQQGEW